MKKILIIILLGVLVMPASASTAGSWSKAEISGHNLTLNYTSSFSIAKNDTIGIIIKNVGNGSINDSITVNKINVSETSKAVGNWTGSLLIEPNSSRTIDLVLNMITEDKASVHINVYYNVSSDNKSLVLEAHYPGVPEIISRGNNKRKNATLISWYPQVVDYIEVNSTLNETIEYSITTLEEMTLYNWSVDGKPVVGDDNGSTYFYTHTWNNSSVGAHTVSFKGNNSDTKFDFRWYVNVYMEGTYSGGNLFDIMDEALENHVTDLKIRMFKYKIAKGNGKSEYTAQKVNQLHNEIAKRQITREALRAEFKAGNITMEEYVEAMKHVQQDAKYNSKLAKGYADIAKDNKEDESEKEFKNISEIEKRDDRRKSGERKKEMKINDVKVDDKKNSERKVNSNTQEKKKEREKKGNGRD